MTESFELPEMEETVFNKYEMSKVQQFCYTFDTIS